MNEQLHDALTQLRRIWGPDMDGDKVASILLTVNLRGLGEFFWVADQAINGARAPIPISPGVAQALMDAAEIRLLAGQVHNSPTLKGVLGGWDSTLNYGWCRRALLAVDPALYLKREPLMDLVVAERLLNRGRTWTPWYVMQPRGVREVVRPPKGGETT